MAKMMSCECGWTLISPMGEGDVKKHAMMHVADAHPGMKMTNDQMMMRLYARRKLITPAVFVPGKVGETAIKNSLLPAGC